MKKILLLLLFAPIMVSAQVIREHKINKYIDNAPNNAPEMFWEYLRQQHPQLHAMKQAESKDKPAMRDALRKMGDIHRVRYDAENCTYTDEKTQELFDQWAYHIGLKGADANAKFFLLHDSVPNAGMYPDGTCIINTGLIMFVQNNYEMIGILAHETAHFVLRHTLNDLWRTEKAARRNQMWAEIGTGLAFGAYSYAQINFASNGAAIPQDEFQRVSQQIAEAGIAVRDEVTASTKVFTRLRYMRETEQEADEVAFWFMEKNGYDPVHYINFLQRLYDSYPDEVKKAKNKTKYSDHPDIKDRIKFLEYLYNKYHKK